MVSQGMPIRECPPHEPAGARQGTRSGETYSTALSLPSWSSLIPEGKVFLDDAGRGGDSCVVHTLADEGSPLMAGCFRERQDHRTIVTVATRALWWNKARSLLAGRGVYCVHKPSNKNLETDDSTIIFQFHLGSCVAALADEQAEGHACCATKVAMLAGATARG